MAYISQEKKKEIAPAIKAVAKKYGRKVSIGIRNNMKLVVKVKNAEDIYKRLYAKTIENSNGVYVDPELSELSEFGHLVNDYWIEERYHKSDHAFLNELHTSMHSKDFYNNDDAMIDYFDRSYYTAIELHK
jgi:hypothetical protein